jgi:DNA-binding NtrC family response regulator
MTLALDQILIGQSAAMVQLRADILRIAPTRIPVLIEGETGTGKELVANALHSLGKKSGEFVAVNVAAVSDSLFESQVFGHRRGAFTGAIADHHGFLETASRGTLFLDEISSLPLHLQPKLLRVLETGLVKPLGSQTERRVELRVVSASNVSLKAEVDASRFRADLLYRLRGDRLMLPPLRERPTDLQVLSEHYVALFARQISRPITLGFSALLELRDYAWPGNIRELRCVLESAVLHRRHDDLQAADIIVAFQRLGYSLRPINRRTREAMELKVLLELYDWDIQETARELRCREKTVYARIIRYGIFIPNKFHRRKNIAVGTRERLPVIPAPQSAPDSLLVSSKASRKSSSADAIKRDQSPAVSDLVEKLRRAQ